MKLINASNKLIKYKNYIIIYLFSLLIVGSGTWLITKIYYQSKLYLENTYSYENYSNWNETANSIHDYFGYTSAGIGGDCNAFKKQAFVQECLVFNKTNHIDQY
jgi:hypothetical protein